MSLKLETPLIAEPRSTFIRWFKQLAATGLDLRWARFLVSFLVLGIGIAFVPDPTVASIGFAVTIASGVVMSLYFAHVLLFRLQISLLECCVLIALLGNILGLLLTMPGIRSVGFFWLSLLIPMIAAWVFYGAVKGLIQAEILAVNSPFKRALFILSGVFTIASPALLLCGGTLWFASDDTRIISPGMAAWSVPLVIFGCIGLALRMRLGLLTRRAARAALANPAQPL